HRSRARAPRARQSQGRAAEEEGAAGGLRADGFFLPRIARMNTDLHQLDPCLSASSASSVAERPFPVAVTDTMTDAISYLALGDSYTIGEGIDEAGRWPLQLAA